MLDGLFEILRNDVKNGTLPQVSWITAPESYTEHPQWPSGYGAWYTSKVLDALTSNPEVWSKTAFILTYDENDGFFDHVVSPIASVPGIAGQSTVSVTEEYCDGTVGGVPTDVAGPFGGFKSSGIGREFGAEGLAGYFETKTIHLPA